MNYLIANWKSNLNNTQSITWLEEIEKLNPAISLDLKTIICLPFTDIPEFNRHLNLSKTPFCVGAQTVSQFSAGKHTGEITAEMLSELVSYCLVGHSERRNQFGETSRVVAKQSAQLLKYNITPIVCLDSPYVDEQIKTLLALGVSLSNCLFVYEPLAAIGSGRPESPKEAAKIISKINLLTGNANSTFYGGSISPQNVRFFIDQPSINGVLVGNNSLRPAVFSELINLLA